MQLSPQTELPTACMVAQACRCLFPICSNTSYPAPSLRSSSKIVALLLPDHTGTYSRTAPASCFSSTSSEELNSLRCTVSACTAISTPGITTSTSAMAVETVVQDPCQTSCIVVKSPSDEREYEVVRLSNGLCALLVHDPKISENQSDANGSESEDDSDEYEEDDEYEEGVDELLETSEEGESSFNGALTSSGSTKKMAAAALVVGVGSFSDPKDAQGLAHFLEHMLFMGSSKFPDENEYEDFLSKHGGSSNGFTDTEHTCFYFEVNHKFLKPALDRFSQFFISPLVKAEAMEREVQAVDSEYEQHLQSDGARLSQLQCNTAQMLHPFNCFSWGNRKSLSEPVARGVDMRGKLMKMYEDHYLAGRMKLTVIGGESLDTLKDWVIELFNGVRAGGEKQLRFPWEGDIWERGKIYRVKSVKDQHYMSIIWQFPCLQEAYLQKPHDYISHLVGHEGTGSLLSVLRLNGWATALSAGIGDNGFERSSAGYMFNVIIYLTDSGLEKVEEVAGLVYQYLKMVRSIGPQEWVFKELQAMTNMEFKFVEEEHPDDYAVNLATNMHLYPEQHTIYGDYALEVWNPELVQSLLDVMTPERMRLDIVTKSFDVNGSGVQHEQWFGAPYTVEDVANSLIKLWADPPSINPMFRMPVLNEFIPTDFSIREIRGSLTDFPRLLIDEPSLKLWYKFDYKFRMPRANAYFLISCRGAYDNAKAAVLTELYVKLIKDALSETLYLANVARLESSLSVAVDKIEIKIHGFNEKLALLATKISSLLKNFAPSADRFQVMKEELKRGYANMNVKPLKHATYLRMHIVKERFWCVEEKIEALSSLSLKDLNSFIPQLVSKSQIEGLCHGNLSEDEAIAIAAIFKDCLLIEPLASAVEPKERILKLPSGISLVYNTDATNVMEENSVIEMYFQLEQDLGQQSVRARALYDLVETIIYEPFFNELRTREQLGYNVGCSARLTYRILGFCFRVLSAKFSPSYLKQRIDAFISGLPSLLEGISNEEFESYVKTLIETKLESDHSLGEETDRYWVEVVEQRYLFNINELEAEELKRITKEDVIEWYKAHLCGESPSLKKLSIFVWGSNARAKEAAKIFLSESEGEAVDVIKDLAHFKLNREYFPPLC